jgi:hypothetical protein
MQETRLSISSSRSLVDGIVDGRARQDVAIVGSPSSRRGGVWLNDT